MRLGGINRVLLAHAAFADWERQGLPVADLLVWSTTTNQSTDRYGLLPDRVKNSAVIGYKNF